jgi:hypothetical protein
VLRAPLAGESELPASKVGQNLMLIDFAGINQRRFSIDYAGLLFGLLMRDLC